MTTHEEKQDCPPESQSLTGRNAEGCPPDSPPLAGSSSERAASASRAATDGSPKDCLHTSDLISQQGASGSDAQTLVSPSADAAEAAGQAVPPDGKQPEFRANGARQASDFPGGSTNPEPRGPVPSSMTELLALARQQVKEERICAWRELLATDRSQRLDNEREEPPSPVALWEGLRGRAEDKDAVSAKDMRTCLDRNELGDAELLRRLTDDYRYNHARKQWLRWDGALWADDATRSVQAVVMNEVASAYEHEADRAAHYYTCKAMELQGEIDALSYSDDGTEAQGKLTELKAKQASLRKKAESVRKSYNDRARALRGERRSASVCKVAALGPGSWGMAGDEFDRQPQLLPFRNGILDLETGRLHKPDRRLYMTKGSPYDFPGLHIYNEWWDDHLHKVFCGDEELQDYFERAIGYSCTGLLVNKDLYCALGPLADNGKSVTFNTIAKAMGTYCDTISVEVLLDKRKDGGGPDPELMVLDGLRMGIASEASEQAKFSTDRLKAITGGDAIRARGLYASSQIIRSTVKLWLHTNDVPQMSGFDPGFHKRLRILPFNAQFVPPALADESRHKYPALNKHQVEALQAEAYPAVVSWLARCARKFFADMNFRAPDCVLQTSRTYFEEQDVIGLFLKSCCVVGEDVSRIPTGRLYAAFKKWCAEEASIPEKQIISNKRFSRELQKRPPITVIHRAPSIVWGCLRLTEEWDGKID